LAEYLRNNHKKWRRERIKSKALRYPFRISESSYLPASQVIENVDALEKEMDKVDCDSDLIGDLMEEPDTYFHWAVTKYPQMGAYFKLVCDALLQKVPVLYFSADQIREDPDNFLLFIGVLCGDWGYCDTSVWPEFWITESNNTGKDSPYLSVSLEHLDLQVVGKL
jgi:hypothetical protein